jgi:hypothetical protein
VGRPPPAAADRSLARLDSATDGEYAQDVGLLETTFTLVPRN